MRPIIDPSKSDREMSREPDGRTGGWPGRPRIIPPEAFDQPQPGARRRGIGAWIGTLLAALVVVLGVGVLFSGPPDPDAADDSRRTLAAGDAPPPDDMPATGRILLFGELPPRAWVELDGEFIPRDLALGRTIRVRADTPHTLAVHADGYESWQREFEVPADSTLRLHPETRPAPAEASRMSSPDPRAAADSEPGPETDAPETDAPETDAPASGAQGSSPGERETVAAAAAPARVPTVARDSLDHRLAQARLLVEIGRYAEAVEDLLDVSERTAGLAERYAEDPAAVALRSRADSALAAARYACRETGQADCP